MKEMHHFDENSWNVYEVKQENENRTGHSRVCFFQSWKNTFESFITNPVLA